MKKISPKLNSFFSVLATTNRSKLAEMVLEPRESTGGSENRHENSDQWLYVVEGEGEALVEGKKVKIVKDDILLIEAGETHEIRNKGKSKLKTINIYAPTEY